MTVACTVVRRAGLLFAGKRVGDTVAVTLWLQERRRQRATRFQTDGGEASPGGGVTRPGGEDKGGGTSAGMNGRAREQPLEKPEGMTLEEELEWTRKQLELERLRMRAMQSTQREGRSHGAPHTRSRCPARPLGNGTWRAPATGARATCISTASQRFWRCWPPRRTCCLQTTLRKYLPIITRLRGRAVGNWEACCGLGSASAGLGWAIWVDVGLNLRILRLLPA